MKETREARMNRDITPEATRREKNWAYTGIARILPPAILLILAVAAWELAARANSEVSRVWASPSLVWNATRLNADALLRNLSVTAYEALWGFALAIILGITFGVLLYISKLANATFMPLLTAAQTLPLISIAPFFLWFFGFDEAGKIALVTVFSLFPIAIQTSRGLAAVPRYFADVALTCGATPTWTLWHVLLRVAARQIFSGIRIAGTYVCATAATAEYMGSRRGIGIFLQSAYNTFQAPLVWSATLSIVCMTGALMAVIVIIERLLLGDPAEDSID
ncbi:ABC transporter permease [Alloscardovia macacae]|uniref:ABC transporter permease n=1 Tax=Alloscardovia macacae TaxID=1160091 RepID=A0A261F7B3_9BIFI|nr:ABC transporter permease [Alloscardovia macacae]OZG54923.1 ABC transporter permease [Alloscardovia macacae]